MDRSQSYESGLAEAVHALAAAGAAAAGDELSASFDDAVHKDDGGDEVRCALGRGIAVYYLEEDTPQGCIIKEYPDGRKELVSFSSGSEQRVEAMS